MYLKSASAILLVTTAWLISACAASPRQRPLPTTPITEGPESLQAVRTRLQGRWELTSLTVSTEDGRSEKVDAAGQLAADAFGGLDIEYRISDAGQKQLAAIGIKVPTPIISTTGKVVIDPQQQSITYVGEDFNKRALSFDPKLAALRANPFALEHVRHYEFGGDGSLQLGTRYPSGKDAAVGRWRKLQ
jgi:hypothetical protein